MPSSRSTLLAETLESRTLLAGPQSYYTFSNLTLQDPGQYHYSDGTVAYYSYLNDTSSGILRTDGTTAGTTVIPSPGGVGSPFLRVNQKLYYRGETADGAYVYAYDLQTNAISRFGSTLYTRYAVVALCEWNGSIYFAGINSAGKGMYRIEDDGSVTLVASVSGASNVGMRGELHGVGNRLVLVMEHPTVANSTQVFAWDGTQTAAQLIQTVPHPLAYEDDSIEKVGGGLLFSADALVFRTDGTTAGTVQIATLPQAAAIVPSGDGTFAILHPRNLSGINATDLVHYTDGTIVTATTVLGGAIASKRDPAAGYDSVYVNSSSGVYVIKAGGVSQLLDNPGAYNLYAVGSDVYFGSSYTVGKIELGYTDYLLYDTTLGSLAYADGFQKVSNGVVFALQGKLYLSPDDLAGMPAVSGTLFNDVNRNGVQDAGEIHDTAYRIFVDYNNNGTRETNEPDLSFNAANPQYRFIRLEEGTYSLRANPNPTSYTSAALWPGGATQITVARGDRLTINLPYANLTTRAGTVQMDINLNDRADSSETFLAGITVYADLNSDGIRTPNEPARTTTSTGSYLMIDLPLGNYPIRVDLPAGWFTTSPIFGKWDVAATGTQSYVSDRNFAITDQVPRGYIVGSVYGDINRNGTWDANESKISTTREWLDLDLDGIFDSDEPNTSSQDFSFATFSTAPLVLAFSQPNWQATSANALTLAPGERRIVNLGIDVAAVANGGIAGRAFFDSDGDGNFGPTETAHASTTAWLDDDEDLFIDPGEAVCRTNLEGEFTFNGLESGTHRVRWLLANSALMPTTLGTDFRSIGVTVPAGATQPAATNVLLGSRTVSTAERTSIKVMPFVDLNLNGVQESNELAASSLTLTSAFIDLNGDGVYSVANDVRLTVGQAFSTAPNRFAIYATAATNYIITTPMPMEAMSITPGQPFVMPVGIVWPEASVVSALHAVNTSSGVVEMVFSRAFYAPNGGAAAIQYLDALGQPVAHSRTTFGTNGFRFTPSAPLLDGNYFIKVPGAVLAGTNLDPSADYTFAFHVLAGDMNLDRQVDFNDLLILAQNYGQTSRTYSQGNLNRDAAGLVNFDDLLILAQKYGISIPSLSASRPFFQSTRTTSRTRAIHADLLLE